ncbi:hypothetical protein [Thermohalobacter berrensis]|uniref:Spermine synthase n=1 Tax=Thermohalobacter berrensis TaxID=99594 RepID=A0A419T305_9FIRM|nr:hypothetical protein [Thermohalobacter berrensis]RKD31788.1 hypothetical protein BET03_11950 [Thermohalobacter berrensis]
MKTENKGNFNNLIAIFFTSKSLFIYEILITRLFSTILHYHFVFLTASLAILGIGFGGLIVYKNKNRYKNSLLAFILSLSYIVCVLFIYKLPYINVYIIYSLISSIPFVFGGMIISKVFLENNGQVNKLYFADLLGSTLGSVLIIPIMDYFGFMVTLFIVSIISSLASLLYNDNTIKGLKHTIYLFIFIMLVLIMEQNLILNLEKNFTAYFTSPTTMYTYIKEKFDKNAKIVYTHWDSISRTDVVEESNGDTTIITDGGSSTSMIKFNGKLQNVEYLKKEIGFLPFTLGNNENTLIIGSGGGKDVLLALLGGSRRIDAVEINGSIIDAVNQFKEFNGDIYNFDGVNLYIEDGRKFIEKTDKKYNNIYLSMVMTKAIEKGGLNLSENYVFTKEAIREYFKHLEDDGYLSFMFHSTHDMIKGINTVLEVLLEMGVKKENLNEHFIAINSITNSMDEKQNSNINMPVVIFKKTLFTNKELSNIYDEIVKQDRIIINMPGLKYMDIYEGISKGELKLSELYDKLTINIKPSTDDRPFFYNFTKGLPNTLKILLNITFLLTATTYLYIVKYQKLFRHAVYFGAIGVGFMMIEIPLIQKSILFLGNPAKAFSYILFSLLLSCGIGSFFSTKKVFMTKVKERQIIFILIPIITMGLLALIPFIINNYINIDNAYKLLLISIILFPLGFFMGMAFPMGIFKLRAQNNHNYIPLMWGINGITSVLGSVLALAVSMSFGFNIAIITGALFYLAIFIFNI